LPEGKRKGRTMGDLISNKQKVKRIENHFTFLNVCKNLTQIYHAHLITLRALTNPEAMVATSLLSVILPLLSIANVRSIYIMYTSFSRCPTTDELIRKMCCMYTMEYYSAITKELYCLQVNG
jgi:hypothetical protein